jgi:hypothetical protein
MMITLFAFFLLVIGVVVWVMHLVERWLRIPGFGQ